MAQATAIEWTDLSWNPVHGCSKVSPGCAHCYAETLSRRYRQTLKPWTPANATENVQLKPHKLREPLSGAKAWQGLGAAAAAAGKSDGKLVFVNSTSDLFHEQIPDEYIAQVFAVMGEAQRHDFQVLTKRPERMAGLVGSKDFATLVFELHRHGAHARPWAWPLPNVWIGTSIENRKWVGRADVLRQTPAAVRFISAEPLLDGLVPHKQPPFDAKAIPHVCRGCKQKRLVNWWHRPLAMNAPDAPPSDLLWRYCDECRPPLDLTGIDWLIAGGESGSGHRPFDAQWARDLRDACAATGTAFFVKQLGGARPGTALEDLPEDLRIREFPPPR